MEDILEKQAEDIARSVEADMDDILDEQPDYVALLEHQDQVGIDPETLALTRLTAEVLTELMKARTTGCAFGFDPPHAGGRCQRIGR